jgi:hypothetical protein
MLYHFNLYCYPPLITPTLHIFKISGVGKVDPPENKGCDGDQYGDQDAQDDHIGINLSPAGIVEAHLDDWANHVIGWKDTTDPCWDFREEVNNGWRIEQDANALAD